MPAPSSSVTAFREIFLDSSSAVVNERRITGVLSTEFAVERCGMMEVLEHGATSIDLSRAPLPLCETHNRGALNIGLVQNIRLVGRQLVGDVVFGASERANDLWPDVEAGIVRSLSIGYEILDFKQEGQTIKVTKWQPFEVSLVPVPADPGAGFFRSLAMPQPINQPNPPAPTSPSPEVVAERQRIAAIRGLATRHARALSDIDTLADTAIERGDSEQAFGTMILNRLADNDQRSGGHFNRFAHTYAEPRDTRGGNTRDFVHAASDAILLRSGRRIHEPHPAASDFRGMSVLDMARSCVERTGRWLQGEKPEGVIRAAMVTSDFPAILGDVLHKALRQGTEAEQATHRLWCVVTTADDFRAQSRVILGSAPDLKPVGELGEYTNGPLDEDKSTLVPTKFGRLVSLSWESMLADNLGAFVNIGASMGQAAMRKEADQIYGALTSNSLGGPVLVDSQQLFATEHNNTVSVATGTGKPLTVAALSAGRTKLRRQKNVGGGWLNLAPRVLLVPPERETEAEMLVASTTVHVASAGGSEAKTLEWISRLIVVAEPRLTNTDTFYLVAAPETIGTGEIAIVADGPDIEEIEEKKRDALTWKVRHAFASGFIDFRGIVRVTITT